MIDFNIFLNLFTDYTNSFLNISTQETKENILLKIIHSNNVRKNAEIIAKSENLDFKSFFIAQLCGQFHDIGRFEQYVKFKTFKDSDSVYHGQLGVDVIKKEKLFDNISEDIQRTVLTAIYNHGLYRIEKYDNEEELFFSKLIRDADKIDIYRIVAEYYHKTGPRNIALEYNLVILPEISEKIMNDFLEQKLIAKTDLKTLNDFKIMQLSWIFDINFDCSQKIISENKYLDTIISSMEKSKNICLIKDLLKKVKVLF